MTMVKKDMHKIQPLLNSIVKVMQCHEIPGKYRFFEYTKHKFNRCLITYKIKGAEFSIPWDQWCFWLNYGPENYYPAEILPFTKTLNEELGQFDFFDLGADVGVVSALVNKNCQGLKNIIALEPNPNVFDVLDQNLTNINSKHKAYNLAISDFNGYAQFSFNAQQGSDHEGHLVSSSIVRSSTVPDSNTVPGNSAEVDLDNTKQTQVTTLDSLIKQHGSEINCNIAIKIDVEGQEKSMLCGAINTIIKADKVVVLLEIHPDVLTRDKQTPEEIFAEAEKARPFKWIVPIQQNRTVDRSRDFFKQFPLQQYDVIGIAG